MSADPKFLLSMLDDEDDRTAASVMAELLRFEGELEPLLQSAQESDNLLIRRRVHQLQTVLMVRKERREVRMILKEQNPNILEGLIALHYQWLDDDSPEMLGGLWEKWVQEIEKAQICTLSDVGSFMFKEGYRVTFNAFPEPELYCLGEVLNCRLGEDVILSVMGAFAAELSNLHIRVVTLDGHFGILCGDEILMPESGWTTRRLKETDEVRHWGNLEILNYVGTQLFSLAVSLDSFHYVASLGECLGLEGMEKLPEPYGKAKI